MSILLLFFSLFIGTRIRYSIIAGIVELAVLVLLLLLKFRNKKFITLSFIFASIGVGLSFIRPSYNRSELTGVVITSKDNYFLISSRLERLYVSERDNQYEVGDILTLYGEKRELSFTSLESEFDFEEYLNKKGVYSEFVPSKIEVKFSNPIRIHSIKKSFLSNFSSETSSIISAILFSDSIDGDSGSLARELHLVRLFSLSGIYLFFAYQLLEKILSKLIKKKRIREVLLLLCFLPHLIFTFPRFAVIKFIFLRVLIWINNYPLKKKFTYLETLSISGILFLLFNPTLARQESFILSYFLPIIFIILNHSFSFKNKRRKYLFNVSMIYVALIPFESIFYHEVMPLAVPLQLLITPAFLFLRIIALLSFIKIPIYSFINSYVYVINKTLTFIRPVFFSIYVLKFNDLTLFLYELILVVLLYYASIKLKPLVRSILCVFVPLNSIYLIPIARLIFPFVSFINVGQGDSTLISYHNTTVLIDTGGSKKKDIATEVLIPYFKSRQIYDIDLLVTTHDDFDHSGAVSSLIKNFTVNQYIKDYQSFPIAIGPLTLTNYNVYPELWKEENDSSLVIGFQVKNYNYLIMGDAPKSIEHAIVTRKVKIDCDILKVGHHGSKTSTSEEFINYIRPKYAVISCGYNNSYGHPHQEVLSILRKYEVVIKRTDLDGTITF